MAKTSLTTAALYSLLQCAAAHCKLAHPAWRVRLLTFLPDYFPHLIIDGVKTPEFKYVRDVAGPPDIEYEDPANGYNGREYPVYGAFEKKFMSDVRCGREAHKYANVTETAQIKAGSDLAFHIKEFNDPQFNNGIFHPGPAQVFMSKSEDLDNDLGDGDWFKIYYLGPNSDTTWATDRATQINFTIPETTPPGKCEYIFFSAPVCCFEQSKN